MGKKSKQASRSKKSKELPKFVRQGIADWEKENNSIGRSRWTRAEMAYDLHRKVKAHEASKQGDKISWGKVAAMVNHDRGTLNDDVVAMTLVMANGLRVADLPPKSYSLYVRLQRLKTASLRKVRESPLQPEEMKAAVSVVEDLVDRHAKLAAKEGSPVKFDDVSAIMRSKLVDARAVKAPAPEAQQSPPPRVEVMSLGIKDTEEFLGLLKDEFDGPTYKGCEVGIATAEVVELDGHSISAALDKLKATALEVVPMRGQVWLCLRRKTKAADRQPEAA